MYHDTIGLLSNDLNKIAVPLSNTCIQKNTLLCLNALVKSSKCGMQIKCSLFLHESTVKERKIQVLGMKVEKQENQNRLVNRKSGNLSKGCKGDKKIDVASY